MFQPMFQAMFQTIDLFGKSIVLYFNGRTRAKTRIGGIFTLCFFAFIVWAAYHVSQDMIWHRNPRSVSSESFNENPGQVTIDPETFTFAFGVQNPDTFAHYIDESIYTFEIIQNRIYRVLNSDGQVEMVYENNPLATERCTTSHFGELGPKFIDMELDQLLCFTPEQTANGKLTVQGVFESPLYEYISINIKECNETATTCADADTRKALLEGGYFAVYFTNLAVDTRNYSDPIIKYRDSAYTMFGNNYFKEVAMFLNHVEITSDLGWLLKEPEVREFVKLGSITEMFSLKPDPNQFFRFVVRVDKISTQHERSYAKMQDVIAEVNGLASIGLLGAIIIVAPYANLKFYEGLINELFDVKMIKKNKDDDKEDKKGKKDKKAKKDKKDKKENKDVKPNQSKKLEDSASHSGFFLKKSLVLSGDDEKSVREIQPESNVPSRRVSIDATPPAKRPLTFGDEPDCENPKIILEEKVNDDKDATIKSLQVPSFTEMNAPSMEIDEDKDDAASKTYSMMNSSKNPFKSSPYSSQILKDKFMSQKMTRNRIINGTETEDLNQARTIQTQFAEDAIRKVQSEGFLLRGTTLMKNGSSPERIKPRAVQPQFKLLENYDKNTDAVDAILESLIMDQQDNSGLNHDQIVIKVPPKKSRDYQEDQLTKIPPKISKDYKEGEWQYDQVVSAPPKRSKDYKEDGYQQDQMGAHLAEKKPKIELKNLLTSEYPPIQKGQITSQEDAKTPSHNGVYSIELGKGKILRQKSTAPDKITEKLHFTFMDYIKSFVWRTPDLKEKLNVLEEGKRRINERLDIFNVFKKLREVDKLKLLMLENEQLVLFDFLPKPELTSKTVQQFNHMRSAARVRFKEARFVSDRRKANLVAISYENLKRKKENTLIDHKLMEVFDDLVESKSP